MNSSSPALLRFLEVNPIRFILKGNIFIACCAVALALETSAMVRQPFHELPFYVLIFFATLFSYNLYYFFSKEFGHHRILMLIGIIGSIGAILTMRHVPIVQLATICILSGIYMLPVFTPIGRNFAFMIFKLPLLIVVWVFLTFIMPLEVLPFDFQTLLFGAYRFVFMSVLCLLFFIRDAKTPRVRNQSIAVLQVSVWLQTCLSIWIMASLSIPIGLINLVMSALLMRDAARYTREQYGQLEYLFFIDGKMLLQSIFVMIYYLLTNESGILTQ